MMERGSVLFLCDYKAPYGGNFAASLCCLGDALEERGYAAVYAFPEDAAKRDWIARMRARGHEVRILPPDGTRRLLGWLLRMIDRDGVGVLHVHFGYMLPARLAALLRPKLTLVLHQHSDFSAGRKPSLAARLRRLGLRVLDTLLGKRLRQIYVGDAMPAGRNAVRIRNALVRERFTDTLWDRATTRAALGLPENAALALVFGWSPHIKGVDIAAEALRLLHAAGHTEFVLGLVGGRAYTEERLRAYIAETTACLGTEPYLLCLPPCEDVFRYHLAADVMLSASRSEAFSYSLLEALSVGTPCVVSDIGGTAWAQAFPTTQTFRSGDAADCAKALLRCQEAQALPEAAEQNAAIAAQVLREYDVAEWTSRVIAVYGLDG